LTELLCLHCCRHPLCITIPRGVRDLFSTSFVALSSIVDINELAPTLHNPRWDDINVQNSIPRTTQLLVTYSITSSSITFKISEGIIFRFSKLGWVISTTTGMMEGTARGTIGEAAETGKAIAKGELPAISKIKEVNEAVLVQFM
jgi:hypothetical protein